MYIPHHSHTCCVSTHCRDSSVDIALGYGLDYRGSRFRFLSGAGNNFIHHRVQNGSDAHTASYTMDIRDFLPGVKREPREAENSPPSSVEVKEYVELYLHSCCTSSWLCVPLNSRNKFTSVNYPYPLLIYLIVSNYVFIK
jgi:hypothetical protein